jgi:hypothetical protein
MDIHGSTYEFGEWDNPPTPAVGEAFFLDKKVAAGTWDPNFSVE